MRLPQRDDILQKLSSNSFDVLIIGGGITGAGIALDAATRGLSVCLLEKYDFASGTSSRSTKLIHGGLRYLKQLEFGLVSQVGKERKVLAELAPQLVRPMQMILPIYAKGNLGRTSTRIALWTYDWLAGVQKEEKFQMLSSEKVRHLLPGIREKGLMGGAKYTEYRTDDARLTLEVIKSARAAGAVCLNYAKVTGFTYLDGLVDGVLFSDLMSGQEWNVHAHTLVSAAGPWVDEIRQMDSPLKGKKLQLTKGVHLVFPKEKIPIKHPVYFDTADDKRMVFLIPRNDTVYAGTTDTLYDKQADAPGIDKEDADYVLNAMNHLFPNLVLTTKDVVSGWAGIRPLIYEEGKQPSELSRKDEILVADSGLISIAGGKLTGYRLMAKKIVDLIIQKGLKTNKAILPCQTRSHFLSGYIPFGELDSFIERKFGEAKQAGFQATDIGRLVSVYGSHTEDIIANAFELYGQITDTTERLLYAELQYVVAHEMVCNVSDFLIRRTGALYFEKTWVADKGRSVATILAKILEQTDSEMEDDWQFFWQAWEQSNPFGEQVLPS